MAQAEAVRSFAPAPVVAVHRVRFVEHVPSGIVSVCMHPSSAYVAVARESGDIELWRCDRPCEPWVVLLVISSGAKVGAQAMVWVPTDPAGSTGWAGARLFVASVAGHILEADFHTRELTRSIESHAGAVWSLAVYSVASSLSSKAVIAGSVLAAGCEDGSIRMFGVPYAAPTTSSDAGASMMPPAGIAVCPGTDGRVLSLAWHPSTPLLFAGTNTGVIRGWDMSGVAKTLDADDSDEDGSAAAAIVSTASRIGIPMPVVRMQLESHSRADTLVWCMAVTSDLQVVAGDSLGHVTAWDGRTGTPAVSTPLLRHDADVLALAVAESRATDGSVTVTIASAGVDGRVMIARRLPGRAASRWVALGSHRAHTHDVRSVALLSYSGGSTVTLLPSMQTRLNSHSDRLLVLSGSADTQLGLLRVRQLSTHVPRRLPAFSARKQLIAFAKRAAIIVSYTSAGVDVWNVRRASAGGDGTADDEEDVAVAAPVKPAPAAARARKRTRASVPTATSSEGCDHSLLLSIAAGDSRSKAVLRSPVCVDVSADGRWMAYSAAGGALHIVQLTLTPGTTDDSTMPVWDAAAPTYANAPEGVAGTVSHLTFLDGDSRGSQMLIAVSSDRLYVLLCSSGASSAAGVKRERDEDAKPTVALLYSLPIPRTAVSSPASIVASAATTIVTPKAAGGIAIRKPGTPARATDDDDTNVEEEPSASVTRARASTPSAAAAAGASASSFAVTHVAHTCLLPTPAATPATPSSKPRGLTGVYGGGAGVPSWAVAQGAGAHVLAVAVHAPAAQTGAAHTYVHVYIITRSRGGLLRSLPRGQATLASLALVSVPVASRPGAAPPAVSSAASTAHVLIAGTTSNTVLSYAALTGEPLAYTRAGAAPTSSLELFASPPAKDASGGADAAPSTSKTGGGGGRGDSMDSSALAPTDALIASMNMDALKGTPALLMAFTLHVGAIMKIHSMMPAVAAEAAAAGKEASPATGPALNMALRTLPRRFANVLSAGVLTHAVAPPAAAADAATASSARTIAEMVVVELPWRNYSRRLAAGALVRKTYAS